jgi:1,4-dihydroxy-2-naphthoate octaprenyltransferase
MNDLPSLKVWLQAIRLRTLPLALASIAMGSFLAADEGLFSWPVFILASLTTLFLQVLSNLANDYGDAQHGADSTQRLGPLRSVQSGTISANSMKAAIFIVASLSLISGRSLLIISLKNLNVIFLIFILLGVGSILAALGYTMGNKPYGYSGFGDLFVVIFFGLVGVLGTCYLYTGSLKPINLLPALTSGFFATAVLNINNIRDIDSDKIAGKKSIPVRLGRAKAVIYHWALLAFGFILSVAYTLIKYETPFQWIFLLTLPLLIRNGWEVRKIKSADQLDPSLKKMAIISLLFVILFGFGILK